MLSFNKDFISKNKKEGRIVSNYKKVSDQEKIQNIKKRLHPVVFKIEEEHEEENNFEDIYQSRINAIKNIKKD